MFEIILLFIFLFAVFALSPWGHNKLFPKATSQAPQATAVAKQQVPSVATKPAPALTIDKLALPEDAVLRRHFLTHLQSEVEAALFPRPTDSILQRHYDALVAAEMQNRLACNA